MVSSSYSRKLCGAGDGYNTGGYNFVSPVPIHQITNIARLDYNLTSKQSLFVRGNLQSDNQVAVLQFPGLPPGFEHLLQ